MGLLGMNDERGHERPRSALPFHFRFRKSLLNLLMPLHMSAESCMSISTTSPPFVERITGQVPQCGILCQVFFCRFLLKPLQPRFPSTLLLIWSSPQGSEKKTCWRNRIYGDEGGDKGEGCPDGQLSKCKLFYDLISKP